MLQLFGSVHLSQPAGGAAGRRSVSSPAEKVLGILLDENASDMPSRAVKPLLDQGNAPPLIGAVVLTAVTAATCAVAGILVRRRDVT